VSKTFQQDEDPLDGDVELLDPFAIDYDLLPKAPPPDKPATLWELFLLGRDRFIPRFPEPDEIPASRSGRKNL
jgi:hypothetical protein